MQDSQLGGAGGPGNVARKNLNKSGEMWGKLPDKAKIDARRDVTRNYPSHYREAIEEYTKKMASGKPK